MTTLRNSEINEEDILVSESGGEQYLVFYLGDQVYGVRILKVKEILQYPGVTRVPRTPHYVKGVINLRGSVLPVVDLFELFENKSVSITARTCIIIVEVTIKGERVEAGILVDAVDQVADLPAENIEPPPSFGVTVKTEFITGMGRYDDRFVVLLDLDLILAPEEMRKFDAGARS